MCFLQVADFLVPTLVRHKQYRSTARLSVIPVTLHIAWEIEVELRTGFLTKKFCKIDAPDGWSST
jgi:hypothetical protein